MKEKILLVEDEDEIRQIEKDYLVRDGYRITEACTGKEALNFFELERYDLVVLDLNLPIVDGIEVCKRIRNSSGVPIIMVTARTKEVDELLGLNIGADDYLKKPFSPKVLMARVKALLKRPELTNGNGIMKCRDLTLNIEKRVVARGKKEIKLTTIQFNLLALLMSNKGKVFSRDELIDKGYNSSLPPEIFDRTIDSHIKNIRKAIGDNGNFKFIATVRGVGYKFNE